MLIKQISIDQLEKPACVFFSQENSEKKLKKGFFFKNAVRINMIVFGRIAFGRMAFGRLTFGRMGRHLIITDVCSLSNTSVLSSISTVGQIDQKPDINQFSTYETMVSVIHGLKALYFVFATLVRKVNLDK